MHWRRASSRIFKTFPFPRVRLSPRALRRASLRGARAAAAILRGQPLERVLLLRALSRLRLGPREGLRRGRASLGGDLSDGRAVGERAEQRRPEEPVRRERPLALFEKRPALFELSLIHI